MTKPDAAATPLPLAIETMLAEAQRYERAGEPDAAELRYRAVVQRMPQSFVAQHQLATLLFNKGRIEEALDCMRRACAIDPRSVMAHRNAGLMLLHANRLDGALQAFSAALAIDPRDIGSLVSAGVAFKRLARYDEAVAHYDRALVIDPDCADALSNKGVSLRSLKRYGEALACYDRLIALRPKQAQAYVNRANLLTEMSRPAAALADYDKALELEPVLPEALNGRGAALYNMRRLDEALASYDRVLAADGRNPAAHNGRGAVLFQMRRDADALSAFEQALAVDANNRDALNGKATSLFNLARHADALATYDEALKVKRDDPDSLNGRANALFNLRRFDEAMTSYDRAIAAAGPNAEPRSGPSTAMLARHNRSMLQLAIGDYERGWQDYECRRVVAGLPIPARACSSPYWRGEPLAGKSIVVIEEQGLGDTLQFCRYLPLLEQQGARVTYHVRASLHRLLRTLSPTLRLVDAMPDDGSFDYHTLLMSLPGSFCTRIETIPAPNGYLTAEPERIAQWKDKLGGARVKVGICWQGNPEGTVDVGRSIPLARFAPLAAVPGVELVSLQKTHGLEQIAGCGFDLRTLGDGFDSGPDAFVDTAAVMASLDLVVTSDTSVAHLAGALGVPTWVLLKVVPDWRWRLEGPACAWYPTLRLYRQTQADDWQTPIAAAARDLAAQVSSSVPIRQRAPVGEMTVPVAVGEVLDKITILEIKNERIADTAKRANVRHELHLLAQLARCHVAACDEHDRLMADLKTVNTTLWDVEDEIRECEARQEFGARFIELARAVYKTNDRRAALKRKLNELHGSAIVEEKSYAGMETKNE